MKKFRVFIEAEELKNVTKEDVEAFKNGDKADLEKKFLGTQETSCGDTVEYNSEFSFDSVEEAMDKYKEIRSNETSTFYWGNNLLNLRRVCIEEVEVDEDGDYIDTMGFDWEWLEIN